MIVVVTDGTAELVEPDVLTSLAVRSALSPDRLAAAIERQGLGRGDADGAHVWLDPVVLQGSSDADADADADEGRRAGLAGMILYAASRGWVDPDGRVRAHVEGA